MQYSATSVLLSTFLGPMTAYAMLKLAAQLDDPASALLGVLLVMLTVPLTTAMWAVVLRDA